MKSEPVGGGAERTDLFVVERNNGEWVNACDGTDYSCFLSLSEAEEALKAEADNCEEGESLYRIVRFTRVGASLSAQTPQHLAQRFHETYERLAPQFGYISRVESAKPWAEVPVRNKDLMIAVCAELLGSAAQEGDCPCGATVVRKSDSANKSKLCADCADQEEAPSPAKCGNYKDYVGDGVGCDKPLGHGGNCGKSGVVAEEEATSSLRHRGEAQTGAGLGYGADKSVRTLDNTGNQTATHPLDQIQPGAEEEAGAPTADAQTLQKIREILFSALEMKETSLEKCDRSAFELAMIASNGIFWRNREIAKLRGPAGAPEPQEPK